MAQERAFIPVDFGFWSFPRGFNWPCEDAELRDALADIGPLDLIINPAPPPPPEYLDRFIKLRRPEPEARNAVQAIGNETVRRWLLERIAPNQRGFISAQFVCWLFLVALNSGQDVRDWFNQQLCSETHEVDFGTFERCVGEVRVRQLRDEQGEIENQLKERLPPRVVR